MDGGGIATCIAKEDKHKSLKVFEGNLQFEALVTRHSQFKTPINIVNLYGQVESRSSSDQIKERWAKLQEILIKIEAKGELALIIGDLNAKVGDIIPGNNKKVSQGGKLIRELLKSDKYVLVNAKDKCKGGPFTRIDPSDGTKSVLDLCILSKELYKYVDSLVIDSKRNV